MTSTLATYFSTSVSDLFPSTFVIESIVNTPVDSVPVLSKTKDLISENLCSKSKLLNINPRFLLICEDLYITIGVAKPKAHGQAITRTEIATANESKIV